MCVCVSCLHVNVQPPTIPPRPVTPYSGGSSPRREQQQVPASPERTCWAATLEPTSQRVWRLARDLRMGVDHSSSQGFTCTQWSYSQLHSSLLLVCDKLLAPPPAPANMRRPLAHGDPPPAYQRAPLRLVVAKHATPAFYSMNVRLHTPRGHQRVDWTTMAHIIMAVLLVLCIISPYGDETRTFLSSIHLSSLSSFHLPLCLGPASRLHQPCLVN